MNLLRRLLLRPTFLSGVLLDNQKKSFQKVFTTSQDDVVNRYYAPKGSRIASEGVAVAEGCDDEFFYGSGSV